jgi:TolB-like protein/tetratricopeptide (TPR) repeat protein/tRNA A-37 threonylcarbamoyl transferase component Bud32
VHRVAELLDRLTTALADRYRIERELGQGGMATVYLAQDLKHHRQVAVKVLRPDLAASLGADRFLREIEVAARLQHPHILPLHDSGEADDFLYYVMPYVDGESLRTRLAQGELPIPDAVRILSEVADALAYAHARGVVHRDIKPDNVMLSGRHALVMDFGVAKALSEATGRQQMTTVGVALGTPAYMAPEQAAAEANIDQRADIYALGVMAYELLTGRPPFTGMTAQQILAAHVTQTPEPLTNRRAACPPLLAALVMKCLEKRPADRWQSADEVTRQLDAMATSSGGMTPTSAVPATSARPAAVSALGAPHRWGRAGALILGMALALGVAWSAMRTRSGPHTTGNERRVVVLPFENQGDSSRQYFANGVTEAITTELTGIGGLSVIPRSTAARYRGTTKTVSEIGRELGVGYVLSGTVQWDLSPGHDPKVRVSPELIRVADTSSVWAHGYEAVLSSVFQVYSDVSTEVARSLKVTLDDPERLALARRPTENPEAYDLYLRAIDYSNRGLSRDNFNAAIPMLERAVALDPSFALAWGRLSETLGLAHWLYARRSDETMTQSLAAAERALALQPDLPEAHRAMGYVHYRRREYASALKELAIVQKSEPNSADLIAAIGYVERRQGRWKDAAAHLRRVLDLDPGSATAISQLAETLTFLGQYDQSIAMCRRGMEVGPDQPDSYYFLTLALLAQSGDVAGAARAYRLGLSRMPAARLVSGPAGPPAFVVASDDSLSRTFLAIPTAELGSDSGFSYLFRGELLRLRGDTAPARLVYDSARVILEQELRTLPNDYGYHARLGIVYARLGKMDAAIREGRRAVELLPPERDAYFGIDNVTNLARIYAAAGQAAPAVEQIRRVQALPSRLTAASLRVDPDWDPIRRDPAFQQLLAGGRP